MEVKVIYLDDALDDMAYWKKLGNKIIQQRIIKLIDAIKINPFNGIGKPEALKYEYSGWWSRRIDEKHRIVYRVDGDIIVIAQLRFHYK